MPDFETMYFHLAAKIADAIETLEKVSRDLKVAQLEGEYLFIGDDDIDNQQMIENISQ